MQRRSFRTSRAACLIATPKSGRQRVKRGESYYIGGTTSAIILPTSTVRTLAAIQMTGAIAWPRSFAASIRRRVVWRHPEWWALALSAAAWLVIVSEAAVSSGTTHDAHRSVIADVRDWLLMVLAMMLPLSVAAIQATADRSLWRRRHVAIAAWLSGYIAMCLLFGVALIVSLRLFGSTWQSSTVVLISFLIAAAWQVLSSVARVLTSGL